MLEEVAVKISSVVVCLNFVGWHMLECYVYELTVDVCTTCCWLNRERGNHEPPDLKLLGIGRYRTMAHVSDLWGTISVMWETRCGRVNTKPIVVLWIRLKMSMNDSGVVGAKNMQATIMGVALFPIVHPNVRGTTGSTTNQCAKCCAKVVRSSASTSGNSRRRMNI